MHLTLATNENLEQLQAVYRDIIANMSENGINIWNDIYPCETFYDDIQNHCLYILWNQDDIVGAFALYPYANGENEVKWHDLSAQAYYLDRLGVNVHYLHQGMGSVMLREAMLLARKMRGQYLRLFVVKENQPAIQLYVKNGFQKVQGIFQEKIDEQTILDEYGFEIKIDET